jgi:hypothetical protein
MAAPAIKFNVNVIDRGLQAKINQMSAATGRTVKEETKTVMKGLVKYIMDYTPPGSAQGTGSAAKGAGEAAIARDLGKLFRPVTLKGKRKEQWPDPHSLHHKAMIEAAGAKLHAPLVKYHVDKAKITSLKNILRPHVGLLASGWASGAATLGVPVPAWIARHSGAGRGTGLIITETANKITMRIVNHMPNTAGVIAAQVQRLILSSKIAAIGKLKRQLPYLLKKNNRG